MRAPAFTAIAVTSLALGIGANTAIFSLLDQILLRTLPVKNPSELAFLYHPGPSQGSYSSDEGGGPSFSYPMFKSLQKSQTPFSGLAGARNTGVSLSYNNQPSTGSARLVSGNYFDLLGVGAAIGRLITEEDDNAPGAHAIAVLGYDYWATRFGANPAALNQTIFVNSYPFTIVGVAQKGFGSERFADSPNIYVPVTMKKAITPDWDGFENRKDFWITLFGRLKPGMTLDRAAVEMNVAYRPELEQDLATFKVPREFAQRYLAKKIILKPGAYGRGGLREQTERPMFVMMAITLLVLLICCANVANLQLARAAARTREVAVRLALGASRGQLIRQLLSESVLLAAAGGALGLAAAYWTLRAIIAGMPSNGGLGNALKPSLDARVLLFSMALAIASGILFGLFPALRFSKPDLAPALKAQSGQTTAEGSANVFRKSLATAQIGISLLLLISAGLCAKTLSNLMHVDLGLRTDHLLTFGLAPKLNQYSDARTAQFYDQLLDRLRALPGAQVVTAAEVPPIANNDESGNITVEGYTPPTDDDSNSFFDPVGPDYFRTMGVPLIAGREINDTDRAGAPKVAVVNESFVRHFFPKGNPLGRHLARGRGDVKLDTEIVGIVKDVKYSNIKEQPRRVLYLSYRQLPRTPNLYFLVRTATEPQSMAGAARHEVAALDPNLPIRSMKTMDMQIEENLYPERMMSLLTASFGFLATLLAAIGLYGVLAYNIARRTREIGIRMALGARAEHVRGMIAREVAVMLAIGTAAGIACAAAAGSVIQSFLWGMQPRDPAIFTAAAILLWVVGAVAAYVPARRATRVDPMIALRYE